MDEDQLILLVADDGQGFNPETLSEAAVLGLAGMHERASLVGGRLDVESEPGQGTRVRFKGPINYHSEGLA
jgi:signal transduction histidine kinase